MNSDKTKSQRNFYTRTSRKRTDTSMDYGFCFYTVENKDLPYRCHGFCPFSVTPLQDLYALEVAANLHEVPNSELQLNVDIGAAWRRT